MSLRRSTVDWQTGGLWVALLACMALEVLTPRTIPLSPFLIIPVVASAALGRPALTASLTVVSLGFAIPAQVWLGYEFSDTVRRSVLIAVAGIVGFAVAAGMARTTRARGEALAQVRDSATLLRAVTDGMLDPQILLQPVRDGSGHITDFTYADVNIAAYEHLGIDREDFIGQSLVQMFPNIEESGLLAHYVRCAETGEPVALEDFPFFNGILGTTLRYNIRGSRTVRGRLSLTYSDVTDRFEARQRLAASEEKYRLLAENSSDAVVHVREGKVAWVSPAVEKVLAAPPQRWIGTPIRDVIPPEDVPKFEERWAAYEAGSEVQQRIRVNSVDGATHWVHLHAGPFYDVEGRRDGVIAALRLIDDEVAAEQELAEAQRQCAQADALYRESVKNAAVGKCLADTDGNFIEVNPALCRFFGYNADVLLRMTWMELTAPDYLQADIDSRARMMAGDIDTYRLTKQFIHADGHRIWGDLSVSCIRDRDGAVELFIGQIIDISEEVHTREKLAEALRQEARAEALYRRSVDGARVGMGISNPEGNFLEVNPALTHFFGYDREALLGMTWQHLTAPDDLEPDLRAVADMHAGRLDSYRRTKQFIHADGHLIWGDLSVSCTRDAEGGVEQFVSQINDVTATVEADARNAALTQQLNAELDSAAAYVSSILPTGLTGVVNVSSRYVPSTQLGGDCFDYTWIDDHLIVYLIDVSGHGIEPALLAVSLQNLLRSGTLVPETMLDPAAVLTRLNRQFPMEQQNEHYFTLWYGVYEKATRTLRYSSAGTPPAYAFSPAPADRVAATELFTKSAPVGAFVDTEFTTATYHVPPGCRILIYSDGACELTLRDGAHLSQTEFAKLVTGLAGTPDWSLDDLVGELRDLSPNGTFRDDVSLIRLAFD